MVGGDSSWYTRSDMAVYLGKWRGGETITSLS